MIGMDIFKGNAFSATTLTTSIRDIKYVPSFLGSLNLFTPNPVRTTTVAIERQGDSLALIPTTARGAPRDRRGVDRRNIRNLETVRIAREHRMMADSIQNIRAFGTESELEAASTEIARHQAKMLRDMELTKEMHRLGAIQGILLDADGSTIVNYFTEFGITPPTEIAFNFAARTDVTGFIKQNVIRPMIRALGGRFAPGARIVALCGDAAYDALIANPEVRASYLNWQAAESLRGGIGQAFATFPFGNVEWINYRGTDDGSTVAIGSDKIKFVPVGIPDTFQVAYSPAEGFDFVNTLGQPLYSRVVPDPTIRNEYVDIEVASYPLHICTAPEALLTGRSGT